MDEIVRCRVCTGSLLRNIFSLKSIPLAGDFKTSRDIVDLTIPLDLLFCESCKVLQIAQTVDLARLFGIYAFSSSTIPALVDHFSKFAEWIVGKFKPRNLLEIGCNDGILMQPLKDRGVKVYGVDISENISELGRSRGLDVRTMKFGTGQLDVLKSWLGEVDVISASNSFPHNDDPIGFLYTAKELLAENGTLILEVMYAGNLKSDLQWDSIYHEHLHIHSLESIKNLLEICGFYLSSAEVVDMHSGSLRITAKLQSVALDQAASQILQREIETDLNTYESWSIFSGDSWKNIKDVRSKLWEVSKSGRVWAYGASGRSTMWLNVANLDFVERVVDASPLRVGKFVPGVSIPIVAKDELDAVQPEYTFVTAWNYSKIIKSQHGSYQGKWIIPLPELRIER